MASNPHYVINGLGVGLNPGFGVIFCELFHVPRKEFPSMTLSSESDSQ
jgi:hypothetical protein